jgi:hypothetical protein
MNILRVWGGGVFLPAVWYDTCDAQGVLVYHDMQFAQEVRPGLCRDYTGLWHWAVALGCGTGLWRWAVALDSDSGQWHWVVALGSPMQHA